LTGRGSHNGIVLLNNEPRYAFIFEGYVGSVRRTHKKDTHTQNEIQFEFVSPHIWCLFHHPIRPTERQMNETNISSASQKVQQNKTTTVQPQKKIIDHLLQKLQQNENVLFTIQTLAYDVFSPWTNEQVCTLLLFNLFNPSSFLCEEDSFS
jgi:hypothetical protein